jgi:CDP-diacylglycerol--glycerol-3-phosphate 3-phosphatidyltransferase
MPNGTIMTTSNGPRVDRRASTAFVTIPNLLSLLRGLLGPVVLTLILTETTWALCVALALMIVAEATDYIDGEIARRYDQETEIGRLVDPVCDSVYHLSVFLGFLAMGWMAAWMLFVIYARDLMVPYLRAFARQSGHDLKLLTSGKVKTAVHAAAQLAIIAIALGLFGNSVHIGGPAPTILLLTAVAASIYSLADYVAEVGRLVRS